MKDLQRHPKTPKDTQRYPRIPKIYKDIQSNNQSNLRYQRYFVKFTLTCGQSAFPDVPIFLNISPPDLPVGNDTVFWWVFNVYFVAIIILIPACFFSWKSEQK